MKFIDDLIKLCKKHKMSLSGELLIHKEYHPQNIEHQEQAKWGQFNVRDHAQLRFSPDIPKKVYDFTPSKSKVEISVFQEFQSPIDGSTIASQAALKSHNDKHGVVQVGNDLKGQGSGGRSREESIKHKQGS